MKKIKFPKKTKLVNVTRDLGMDETYEDVEFLVFDDPPRSIVGAIMRAITLTDEEAAQDNSQQIVDEYFEAVTELIIDCNIEGLSFNTADETVESFESKIIPWGFLYDFVVFYISYLITESDRIKKALAMPGNNPDSGIANEKKDEK